mgnify:FL=1
MFEKLLNKQIAKQEKVLEKWLTKHDKENPFPNDKVKISENISYLDDNKFHLMDIYQPYNNEKILPIIINIHGGGFLLGKKEVNKLYCAELAQKGYIVFCVEYPLSPKAKIIDILNDLIIAINKINEIAIDYNGDNNDLYLTGDSAGAYLCVYLSALKNNPNLNHLLKIKNKIIPTIKGLGLISGMFYTNKFDQIGVFVPKLIYGKNYKKNYNSAYYNIENKEIISYLSPCFLVTNKGDFLRHYSVNFSKTLAKYNIKYKLLNINSKKMLPHAFVAMLPETEEAKIANNEMIEFLKNIV